jgi:hypothetical protein
VFSNPSASGRLCPEVVLIASLLSFISIAIIIVVIVSSSVRLDVFLGLLSLCRETSNDS